MSRSTCTWLSLASLCLLAGTTFTQTAQAAPRWNVLFLMADDLRCELGCYGSAAASPNIDGLAKEGLLFTRAYCQQAVCNPSRSSMLSGKRPDSLHLWSNGLHFREKNPDVVTLPQYFQQHGYLTYNAGKIFHNWHTDIHGDPISWSAPEFLHYANHGDDKPMVDGEPPKDWATAPKCERRDVPDDAYYDGRVANEAIRMMSDLKEKQQPFFLAVGFWKPHSPFNAPASYWTRYDTEPPPPLTIGKPFGAPEIAFHDSREILGFGPKRLKLTHQDEAEMRQGYYANVSYMDKQVAKVLSALKELGLRDSTIVVFVSDHGYHLGEHGLWAKTSCFEFDARVPLIIAPPNNYPHAGQTTDALVELVDLYPTLIEMNYIQPMTTTTAKTLDGVSLVPILKDPTQSVQEAAFTQHPRPAYFDRTDKGVPDAMGYSIRTATVRYTEWHDWETGQIVARELYDHIHDDAETRNIVDDPHFAEAQADAVKLLNRQFEPGIAPRDR